MGGRGEGMGGDGQSIEGDGQGIGGIGQRDERKEVEKERRRPWLDRCVLDRLTFSISSIQAAKS